MFGVKKAYVSALPVGPKSFSNVKNKYRMQSLSNV